MRALATGGWFLADGQVIGRKSLNNSVMQCINGILFLRTIDAKSVKKNQEFLRDDAVESMKIVSWYIYLVYILRINLFARLMY